MARTDRDRLLLDLCASAVTLDPDERQAFLERVEREHPGLRLALEAMLALSVDTDDLRERLPFDEVPDALVGAQVGVLAVRAFLGAGGMGVVYLADDPRLGREVALKVLHPVFAESAERRQLFEREQRTLARLVHPHIARVYEGGVTDGGQPYFVMELVEGVALDAWADGAAYAVAERLRLFLDVCDAVQHAHQRGVIHRDLKPSNVLVTEGGAADGRPPVGRPSVKLLDFGVATLAEDAGPSGDGASARAPLPLTPAYASPEQLAGEPVTTQSDVYALGVMLYELLAGRRPYTAEAGSFGEAAHARREVSVPPLAAAVTAEAAARRGTTPERLRRTLRGDLDAVVRKAMALDPAARYASAEALADDLRRVLEDRPVEAHPGSAWGRARKLARRNCTATVTAALALGLLVAVVAVYTWQLRTQRDEADTARQRAETLNAFTVAIFEGADPDENGGADLTARDLLNQGSRRLETTLRRDPRLYVEMAVLLVDLYAKVGALDEASALLETALAQVEDFPPASAWAYLLLDSQSVLALNQGNIAEADSLLRVSLFLKETSPWASPLDLATSHHNLATSATRRGAYAHADSLFRLALDARRELKDAEDLTASLRDYGYLKYETGEYDAALSFFEEAEVLSREAFGATHSMAASLRANRANVLWTLGDLDAARETQAEALALNRTLFGETHPRVGRNLITLGLIATDQGHLSEAEAFYDEGLTILRQKLGPDHVEVGTALGNLGDLYVRMGRPAEAEPLLRENLSIDRRVMGDDHPNTLISLNNLAFFLLKQARYAAAEPLLREAAEGLTAAYGAEHPHVAAVTNNLARVLVELDALDEAEAMYDRALRVQRSRLDPSHPSLLHGLYGWGQLALRRADYGAALARFGEMKDRAARSPEGGDLAAEMARVGLARTHIARGETAAGCEILSQPSHLQSEEVAVTDDLRRLVGEARAACLGER